MKSVHFIYICILHYFAVLLICILNYFLQPCASVLTTIHATGAKGRVQYILLANCRICLQPYLLCWLLSMPRGQKGAFEILVSNLKNCIIHCLLPCLLFSIIYAKNFLWAKIFFSQFLPVDNGGICSRAVEFWRR